MILGDDKFTFANVINEMMKKILNEDLGRISVEQFKNQQKNNLFLVLDNVRSALNVGSVFRTADAFAVSEILLIGITPTPENREVLKSSLGSEKSVEWKYFESVNKCNKYLKDKSCSVQLVEQIDVAVSLEQFVKPSKNLAIVFGNEVNGISDEFLNFADGAIEIPQFGTKHSLNISVSAGIVLWQLTH